MNGLRFDPNQPSLLDRILGKTSSLPATWERSLRSHYQALGNKVGGAWSAIRAWVDGLRLF